MAGSNQVAPTTFVTLAGLVPAIHAAPLPLAQPVLHETSTNGSHATTWMAGTSPAKVIWI
jgi:hypothetical protein